jgi:carboxylate-amine ligase
VGISRPPLTIGIEEEYLLVDLESRDLAADPPPELLARCESRLASQVAPELLRSQIEIGTRVCRNITEAREDLGRLRSTIIEVARDFNLAPIAASTHPFAHWQTQRHTEKERYEVLTRDMQAAARRLLICGMHVHVGIDDDDQRIDLLNQMSYFLPFLLALSCSSPFWLGEDTGLQSYRLTVFDSLPRTRLPERFASFSDYQQHVDVLTKGGLIEDATKIWWDMRPSARYPTLEMRITDVCTRMDDALSLAALTVSIIAMLARVRTRSMRWRIFAHMLVYENRWRAMRYGMDNGMLDFVRAETVPFDQVLDELIDLVAPDAEELGCLPEVEATRRILARGNSAHRQLRVYKDALAAGRDPDQALRDVVDFLVGETGSGI